MSRPQSVVIRIATTDIDMLDKILQAEGRKDPAWDDMVKLAQKHPNFEQRFMGQHLSTFRRNKIGELIRRRYLELGFTPEGEE